MRGKCKIVQISCILVFYLHSEGIDTNLAFGTIFDLYTLALALYPTKGHGEVLSIIAYE